MEMMERIEQMFGELKTEITSIRTELIGEISSVRTKLMGEITDIKESINSLNTKVSEIDNRLLRVELTLENEIKPNIQLLAEGFSSMASKRSGSDEIETRIENLEIQYMVHDKEIYNLKKAQ